MMTAIMSGFVTLINTGFDAQFFSRWLRADLLAWSISFPAVLVLAPRVRKVVDLITS
jgi:hypothetical protein